MKKQEVVFNYGKSEGSHEVYLVVGTDTNTLLYIGHGVRGRHKHACSGTSHVYGLNYEHFKGTPISIRVVHFADKEVANLVEAYLIAKLRPKYNRVGLMTFSRDFNSLQEAANQLKVSAEDSTDIGGLLDLELEDFKALGEERLRSCLGKKPTTKDLIQAFKTDPGLVKGLDPDLHSWLSLIGTDKAEVLQSKRGLIKAEYEKRISRNQYMNKTMLKSWFKVGASYLPETLVEKVERRTQQKCKSTHEALKMVRKYYEVAPTTKCGKSAYRIVRIL